MAQLEGKWGGDAKVELQCTAGKRGRENVLIGRFKCSSLVLSLMFRK